MKSITTSAVAAAVAVFLSLSGVGTAGRDARIASWGFDLAGMDRSVAPGDDFYRYAGGSWMKNTPIPPDRSSWGPFFILRAKAEDDVNEIVKDMASRSSDSGSIERKVADDYNAYLDTAAIERAGLDPVRDDLAAIAAARTHDDVARLMARPDLGIGGPFMIVIWPDAKNPDRYTVNIGQGGLGMPNRDYFLDPGARFAEIRNKYRVYVERMLSLAGYPDASRHAETIVALETEMAKRHWPREKVAHNDLTYNPKSRSELMTFAPDFAWTVVLSAEEIPDQNHFVVKHPDPVRALSMLFRATPVEDWRAYLTFHYLNATADVLPAAFDDLAFDFNRRTLLGQPQQRERWKRATSAVDAALGEAIGKAYVARHFTPEARDRITQLVENLRAAYRARIANLTWMSAETKQEALRKLAEFRVKVGYPDTWRDYSTLVVRAGDPVGNRKRAALWEWRRKAMRLDKPTDRDEWGMTPQTVNAYYNSFFNEIVFPAAILQAPYFDPDADPAVNYGGIGGVIGHEMGHGFDDQGSKSDENGGLRIWWTPQDLANFKARTGRLSTQYSQYEVLPGLHLNGALTLSENIGDNGGLSIALDAYRMSLHGSMPPVIDGFTGEQRFFLSWAQTYRENMRENQLRAQLASDPHSPAEFRVNGVVRNMDAWYHAFGVKPGDKLYLAPSDRVHIW